MTNEKMRTASGRSNWKGSIVALVIVFAGIVGLWLHSSPSVSTDPLLNHDSPKGSTRVTPETVDTRTDGSKSKINNSSVRSKDEGRITAAASAPNPPTENQPASENDQLKQTFPHSKGEPRKITDGYQTYELDESAAKQILSTMKFPESNGQVIMLQPADPNEPQVPFTRLSTDCPVLPQIPVPINFRVSGTGDVLEAVPLTPDYDIPKAFYSCHFTGGPNANFNTEYSRPDMFSN